MVRVLSGRACGLDFPLKNPVDPYGEFGVVVPELAVVGSDAGQHLTGKVRVTLTKSAIVFDYGPNVGAQFFDEKLLRMEVFPLGVVNELIRQAS
jgi:hypothetical protein